MALFRRFFYRKPPDRLLEISERVYGNLFLHYYLMEYFLFKILSLIFYFIFI
ncbi:hypothetical protein ES288_D07G082000v1 [Gossypium darwinii]|uniref:Uncharacterized protein n=1 Tax=Gossypium darwinii TaxID=34276 RepID=A0A5D2BW01_GOSDA|nr:hypothetical protein ES288_D07G082000v1 [Gossypium darwinii]